MCMRVRAPVWSCVWTYHFLEFELYLLRAELLAQRSLPQQHVTVVGQQLWTLGLWLTFKAHTGDIKIYYITIHSMHLH